MYFAGVHNDDDSMNLSLFNQFWQLRFVRHLVFWTSISLLLAYTGSLFTGDFKGSLQYMIALLPSQMLAAYLMVYFQIPNWLVKGSWLRFLLLSAIVAYLIAALTRLSSVYIAEPLMGVDGIDESLWEVLMDPVYLIRVYVVAAYIPVVFFFLIKMTNERFTAETRMVKLEKEKQSAELDFLKAQINPHFLFNTLNNIYSLAIKKSDDTPEMILKLSEILDYTIYESNVDRVPITKEWELIENYADLQALRHHDKMTIALNQDIDNPDAMVAPLILISLVENAFKHGLKGKREEATIDISLIVKNGKLLFRTYNTRTVDNTVINGGVGLNNTKRQLALLYPGRYEIAIVESETSFEVSLSIILE